MIVQECEGVSGLLKLSLDFLRFAICFANLSSGVSGDGV